jgi:hypothetical protein
MARSSVRRLLMPVFGLWLMAMPLIAQAEAGSDYRDRPRYVPPPRYAPPLRYGGAPGDDIYRYGYRTEATLVLTPAGYVWAVPSITSVPGVGITGAPLHGLVCSKGMIAELPIERQALYLDGATVGKPGYRCLDFQH